MQLEQPFWLCRCLVAHVSLPVNRIHLLLHVFLVEMQQLRCSLFLDGLCLSKFNFSSNIFWVFLPIHHWLWQLEPSWLFRPDDRDLFLPVGWRSKITQLVKWLLLNSLPVIVVRQLHRLRWGSFLREQRLLRSSTFCFQWLKWRAENQINGGIFEKDARTKQALKMQQSGASVQKNERSSHLNNTSRVFMHWGVLAKDCELYAERNKPQ